MSSVGEGYQKAEDISAEEPQATRTKIQDPSADQRPATSTSTQQAIGNAGGPAKQAEAGKRTSVVADDFSSKSDVVTPTSAAGALAEVEAQRERGTTQYSAGPAPGRISQGYQPTSQTYDSAFVQDQPVSWTGPEADSQESEDTDSAIGSYASTRSTSLNNSAYDYRTFHGRRYHAYREGTEYALPNDETEMDRLDLQHHLFLMTLGGQLHKAPLRPDIQYALDIGTGTGIWAIDFADAHPSCLVTGTDLSPIQPAHVPPNCRFYVEDAEGGGAWAFDAPLDYIHGRMLVVAIKDWRTFFARAFAALAPGGWLELQDLNFPVRCDDGSAGPDSPLMRWSRTMMAGARRFGVDLAVSNAFPALLAETGFVNIASETHAWPVNRWPRDRQMKELATWVHQNFLQGLQGFSMAYFVRALGWSLEDLEAHLGEVREQARDRGSHVYMPISSFWAQKPGNA